MTNAIAKMLSVPVVESAVGAAAGGLLARWGAKAAIRRHGDARLLDDPNYYKGVRRAATLLGMLAGGINPWLREAGASDDYRAGMLTPKKAASYDFDPEPFLGEVDKAQSSDILTSDLYLRPYEKRTVLGLLTTAAEPAPGKTSQFGLVQSALRAGVGFVPAYAFGQLAGKALGVNRDLASKISRVGALAYALRSSGIMEYL